MRHRKLFLIAILVLAVGLVSGCGKRQLTKPENDRLDAIAAKIAEAERIGAPDCIPYREIARAKVLLEDARHELAEHWQKSAGDAENDLKVAEAAADAALAKARECVAARMPAPAPATAPAPPPPAAPVPAAPPPASAPAAAEESVTQNIYFDFDKSFIRQDAKPELQKAAEYMKANKAARIRIEGNCDERGTSEYNMALGERRAAGARKYLVDLGVDAGRLSTISYGKERPVCAEQNEECWQKNRRGDLVLQK